MWISGSSHAGGCDFSPNGYLHYNYRPHTDNNSQHHAIWMADVLERMIKNGVFMANEWALTAKGGYGGLGMIGQSDAYPTYYTYQRFKMFENELVYPSSDDAGLSIMLVNLSPQREGKSHSKRGAGYSEGGGVAA